MTLQFGRHAPVILWSKLPPPPRALAQGLSLEYDSIVNVKEMTRTIVYSGKVDASCLETRIRLHKEIISKSSLSIPPPDPDTVEQAIRRGNHHVFHRVRCCEVNTVAISSDDHGWEWNEEKLDVDPI